MPPEAELASLFALAHGPPAAVAAAAPEPAAAAAPEAAAQSGTQRKRQKGERQIVFLNFQMLNGANDTEFMQLCRLAVLAHAAAYDPRRLWCLCADPAGMGAAC